MNNIVWLASYPKSGNTWFRAFLSNLLGHSQEEASINDLGSGPIASSRALFDEHVGIPAADLSGPEETRLRPLVYQRVSDMASEPIFMKVHDAYNLTREGRPLFPPQATRKVLYLLRNPFDVAVSYAHHNACTLDRAITMMSNDQHYLSSRNGSLSGQLPQRLRSWSNHVLSWVEAPEQSVLVLRYEDLKREPLRFFQQAVDFLDLPVEPAQVEQAIEYARFERLKKQESEKGFAEKPLKAQSFFREGSSGGWRSKLSRAQWSQLFEEHQTVLERFQYLEECAWES